jgi:hypothetical protein
VVARALKSEIVFHRDAAGLPRREHALWFLSQMARWGQVDLDRTWISKPSPTASIVRTCSARRRCRLGRCWSRPRCSPTPRPASALFDGAPFDPADARGYAASFAIGRARV